LRYAAIFIYLVALETLALGNTNRISSYSCCKSWIFLPDVQRPEHLAAQLVSVTETLLYMINGLI